MLITIGILSMLLATSVAITTILLLDKYGGAKWKL